MPFIQIIMGHNVVDTENGHFVGFYADASFGLDPFLVVVPFLCVHHTVYGHQGHRDL